MTPANDAVSQTEREDMRDQHGLLHLVLAHHPTILSVAELKRQMNRSANPDAFDRALWTLASAGLLRQDGDSVFPTYAALTFERLS